MEVEPGSQVVLPECGFTPAEGSTFRAWDVGGKEYRPGDRMSVTADTAVKALWDTASFTLTYAPGDGTGSPVTETHVYGTSVVLKECMFTAPGDSSFGGWSIGGKTYDAGDTYVVKGDALATATWESGSNMMIIIAATVAILVLIVAVVFLVRRHT